GRSPREWRRTPPARAGAPRDQSSSRLARSARGRRSTALVLAPRRSPWQPPGSSCTPPQRRCKSASVPISFVACQSAHRRVVLFVAESAAYAPADGLLCGRCSFAIPRAQGGANVRVHRGYSRALASAGRATDRAAGVDPALAARDVGLSLRPRSAVARRGGGHLPCVSGGARRRPGSVVAAFPPSPF